MSVASTSAAILSFRVKAYANAVYVYNTNRLTAREGYSGVPSEYYTPVQQYAAVTYTQAQLDLALACGWINQQEYNETLSFIPVV